MAIIGETESSFCQVAEELRGVLRFYWTVEKLYKATILSKDDFDTSLHFIEQDFRDCLQEVASNFGEEIPKDASFSALDFNAKPKTKAFVKQVYQRTKEEIDNKWASIA